MGGGAHDLGNEVHVGGGHGAGAEERLDALRELGAARVARVHGDVGRAKGLVVQYDVLQQHQQQQHPSQQVESSSLYPASAPPSSRELSITPLEGIKRPNGSRWRE